MKLHEAIEMAASNASYYVKKAEYLAKEINLLSQLDLSVVSSVEISDWTVTFYIDNNSDREQQRAFVHAVARLYNAELEKSQNWDKSSLQATGYEQGDTSKRSIRIYGYIPPTCNLVEVAEPASEYDLKQAEELLASKTRKSKKIVCSEVEA